MIRVIILCCFIFSICLLKAQNCQLKRNEFDTTLKSMIRITDDFNISQNYISTTSFRLIQNGSNYFLKVLYEYEGLYHYIIEAGSEIEITFENSILSLKAERNDTASAHLNNKNNRLLLSGRYPISKSNLVALSEKSVLKLKLITNKKIFEVEVKTRYRQEIRCVSKCLLDVE